MDPTLLSAGCVARLHESSGVLPRNTTVQILQIAKQREGYHLQVSDGRHSTFLQLDAALCESVADGTVSIGKLCVLEEVTKGKPCPIITAFTPLSLRTGVIGAPVEIKADDKTTLKPRLSAKSPSPTTRGGKMPVRRSLPDTLAVSPSARSTTSPRSVLRKPCNSPQARKVAPIVPKRTRSNSGGKAKVPTTARTVVRPKAKRTQLNQNAPEEQTSVPLAVQGRWQTRASSESWQHIPDSEAGDDSSEEGLHKLIECCTTTTALQPTEAVSPGTSHNAPKHCPSTETPKGLTYRAARERHLKQKAARAEGNASADVSMESDLPDEREAEERLLASRRALEEDETAAKLRVAEEEKRLEALKLLQARELSEQRARIEEEKRSRQAHMLQEEGKMQRAHEERVQELAEREKEQKRVLAQKEAEVQERIEEEKRRHAETLREEGKVQRAQQELVEREKEQQRVLAQKEAEVQERLDEEKRNRQAHMLREEGKMQRAHEERVQELAEREKEQKRVLAQKEAEVQERIDLLKQQQQQAESQQDADLKEREAQVQLQLQRLRAEQAAAEQDQLINEETLRQEQEDMQRENRAARQRLSQQRREVEQEQEEVHQRAREEMTRLDAQVAELKREQQDKEARVAQGEEAARLTEVQVAEQQRRLHAIEEEAEGAKRRVTEEETRLESLRQMQGREVAAQRERLEQEERAREARRREEMEAQQQAHQARVAELQHIEDEQLAAHAQRERDVQRHMQTLRREQQKAEEEQQRFLEEREKTMQLKVDALRVEQRKIEEEHHRQEERLRLEHESMQQQQQRIEEQRLAVTREQEELQLRAREEERLGETWKKQQEEQEVQLKRQREQSEEELRIHQREAEESARHREAELQQLQQEKERQLAQMQEEGEKQLRQREEQLAVHTAMLKAQLERKTEEDAEAEPDNRLTEARERASLPPQARQTPHTELLIPVGTPTPCTSQRREQSLTHERTPATFHPQLQPRVMQSPLAMLRQLPQHGAGRALAFDDDMSESADERMPRSRHRVNRVRGSARSSSGSQRGSAPSQCGTSACGSRSASAKGLFPRDTLFDPASSASSNFSSHLRPRQMPGNLLTLAAPSAPSEAATDMDSNEEWGTGTLRFATVQTAQLEKQLEELHTQMEANRSLEATARGFQEVCSHITITTSHHPPHHPPHHFTACVQKPPTQRPSHRRLLLHILPKCDRQTSAAQCTGCM